MFLVSSLYRTVSFSHHLFQVCIFLFFFLFFIFFFFLTRLVKIHGFSKCLSVLYRKITWFIWRKKKTSSLHRDETTMFYMVYMEENVSPRFFCAILTKSMEFLSSLVFHTVLWTTVFHPILLFLLNKALLVIVWNNLDSNRGILTRIETPLTFDSIGQKILETIFSI